MTHSEFTTLLARAGITQASFARLCGVTARGVNNWCAGRKPPPLWAVALAVALTHINARTMRSAIQGLRFAWHETLGVAPDATMAEIKRARANLAKRHHPDMGGDVSTMQRVNAAHDTGLRLRR